MPEPMLLAIFTASWVEELRPELEKRMLDQKNNTDTWHDSSSKSLSLGSLYFSQILIPRVKNRVHLENKIK